MKNLLCKLGIHRPLKIKDCNFVDIVSGKEVFNASCSCGKTWLTDSVFGWFGFKVERNKK